MSRITTHCVCQNHEEHVDTLSKVYSILPNYFGKTEINPQSPGVCKNNQSISKKDILSRSNKCNVCKSYENIEHFISGSFRPHSCPTEDNDGCIQKQGAEFLQESHRTNPLITQDSHKFNRKGSRSSMKQDKHKFHNQLYMQKHSSHVGATQRLDTIHQGLNFYINKNGPPLITNNAPELLKHEHRSLDRDVNTFIDHSTKKPSCGLKYIIFQKFSIMTHFLTKTKNKSSSLALDKKQLSEENLFKESKCYTKRSKSFHLIDANDNRFYDNSRSLATKQVKQRLYRTKGSDTSNSSTGSIDAHAGSPITIMSTACGNFLGGLSNPLMANAFNHGNSFPTRNECRPPYTSPEIMGFSQKKNQHQLKHSINNSHIDSPPICTAHQNYACPNCLYPFQKTCHPMLFDQSCQPHYHAQSPIPAQCSSYHCCHFNHSHLCMHQRFSQFPSSCCQQSNQFCHCSAASRACIHQAHQEKICQYENRVRSTLCQSCQYNNTKRCQSETLDDNRRSSEKSNNVRSCHQQSNQNVRYKLKSEIKTRTSKLSPSNHSKSVSSSIPPPPPPPPPSSLYSANEAVTHKTKIRKHCHNKVGKLCTNCNFVIPHAINSSNNVQNIIYSHLNDTNIWAADSKLHHAFLPQNPDLLYSVDSPIGNVLTNTKQESSKGKFAEKSDNDSDNGGHQLCSPRIRGADYCYQKEVFGRRSAETFKENSTNYKTKFLSKTPETYKSKNDRRHRKHQYETQKISKHKSISTTREYKYIDNDLFYRDDSMDSPEAGSFIYPISPLVQKNIQTVVPKKVSSFNNRQHCNYSDISYGKPELIRKAFQENMLSLREVGWYWGPLSFTEAESLMENKANGTFLVRDSGHDTYFLSLTFRVRETTYHTRIEYSQGTFSFWSQPESHSATTIVEFIDKAVSHSQSGKFHYFLLTNVPGQPPMEVSLLYPLSRHQIVHSLKHLSRFVILSHIRKDHISDLSVPPALRMYLLEKQYYISNLDEFVTMTLDSHPLSYKTSTTN